MAVIVNISDVPYAEDLAQYGIIAMIFYDINLFSKSVHTIINLSRY